MLTDCNDFIPFFFTLSFPFSLSFLNGNDNFIKNRKD